MEQALQDFTIALLQVPDVDAVEQMPRSAPDAMISSVFAKVIQRACHLRHNTPLSPVALIRQIVPRSPSRSCGNRPAAVRDPGVEYRHR